MYIIQDEAAEAARNAGGNIVGGDELIKQVRLHAVPGGILAVYMTGWGSNGASYCEPKKIH